MENNSSDTRQKRDWNGVLRALATTHTTSVRTICQDLKCSRTWANKYVVPHISDDVITLSNTQSVGGFGRACDDSRIPSADWCQVATRALRRYTGDPSLTISDRSWFPTAEYHKLLMQHIVCTQQVKLVPVALLCLKSKLNEFTREYQELDNAYDKAVLDGDFSKATECRDKRNELCTRYLSKEGKIIVNDGLCRATKRTDAPHCPVELPFDALDGFNIRANWCAPHDMKSYGDSDETVHRQLFKRGMVRLQLMLPDKDGVPAEKIFYMDDPTAPKSPCAVDQTVLVRYDMWCKYEEKLLARFDK